VAALYEINPSEPGAVLDTAWVDRTNQRVKADTMRLDAELRGYKNNLIKESIRV
jgi:COP9 signalosome complex subunit 1